MTGAGMGAFAMGKSAGGSSANMQLATVVTVGATVTAQIDGSDSTFTLICDADRLDVNPATVGDRVLCTRQGSSMYEIALVSSAYTPPGTPFVAYGLSADQSIPNSTATLLTSLGTALHTRVVFLAPTLGVFTIPTTGLYSMVAKVGFALGPGTVTRRYVEIVVNGSPVTRAEQASATVGQWYVTLPDIRPLTAGDTVSVQVFQLSTAALNVVQLDGGGNNGTTFKMAKVG